MQTHLLYIKLNIIFLMIQKSWEVKELRILELLAVIVVGYFILGSSSVFTKSSS